MSLPPALPSTRRVMSSPADLPVQHPDAEFDPALDDDFDPEANGGCGGLRGDPGVSALDPETGLPTQFLLRIGFAPELLGGWVSLKAESSLLSVHLLNYLLLERLLKRRRINLVGLDHTQIALARCVSFERTGVIPTEEAASTAANAGSPLYEEVHDETAVGDVWTSQSQNLSQNSGYKLNPALPVLFLFLRSNHLFGTSLSQVQMRLLLPPALVSPAPKDPAAALAAGLVTSPVQYLDATGKRALRLCSVATRTSVWEVRHLDDFSICEDTGDEAAMAAQAASGGNKQPIVYIRDQFYRFLTAAVASPAQAAPWVPDPNDPHAMPPPRPPTEVGTVLITASHHDEASKWVIEVAAPAAAAPTGGATSSSTAVAASVPPQSFLLRNFNLLSPTPTYLYLGLTRDMDGVLQPALVDRADALRVELVRPMLYGWLEKRPKGDSGKPAKKGDKFLRRFFMLESGSQGSFGYFNDNATVNAAGFDPRVPQQRQAAGALKRSYNLHPSTASNPKKEPVQFASASTLPAEPCMVVLTAKKGVKGAADLWLRANDAATAARWATALQSELAGECFLDARGYATAQPLPADIFAVARVEYERAQREAELREEMEQRAAEEAEAARQQQEQQGPYPDENVNPPYDEHPAVQQAAAQREYEEAEEKRRQQEAQDAEYQDQLDYERDQQFSLDPYSQFAPRPRKNAQTQPPPQQQPPAQQQQQQQQAAQSQQQPQRPARPTVSRDPSSSATQQQHKPEEEEKSGLHQNAGAPQQQQQQQQQHGGAIQQQNQTYSLQQQNKGGPPLELRASRAQADSSAAGPGSRQPPPAAAARATTPSNLTDRSSTAFDAGERTAHMDGGLESGRSNVDSPAYDPFAAKAEQEAAPAPAPAPVSAAPAAAVADPEPAPKPISNAAPSPSGGARKPPPNAQAQLLRAISVASNSPKQGAAPAPVARAGSSPHITPAASPAQKSAQQPQSQPAQAQQQPQPQQPDEPKSSSSGPVPAQSAQPQAQSQPPPVRPAPLTKKPSLAAFNPISPKVSSQPPPQQQHADAPPNHRRGASSISLEPQPKSTGAPPPASQPHPDDGSRDDQINDLKAQLAAEQALASLEAMRPASPKQQEQQPPPQQQQAPQPASSSPPRPIAGAQPNQQAQAQALAQAAAARHAKQHGTSSPAAAPAEEPAPAKEDDLAMLAAATLRKSSTKKKKSTQRQAFVPLGGTPAGAQDNSSPPLSPGAQPSAGSAEGQPAQSAPAQSAAPAPAPAAVVNPNLVRASSRALPATPAQQQQQQPAQPQQQSSQQDRPPEHSPAFHPSVSVVPERNEADPQDEQRSYARQPGTQPASSGPPAAVEDDEELHSVPQPRKVAVQDNVARSAGAGTHDDSAAAGGSSPALNPTPLPPQPVAALQPATHTESTPTPAAAPAPATVSPAKPTATTTEPAPRRQADEPVLAPFVAPQFPTQLRTQPSASAVAPAPAPTPAAAAQPAHEPVTTTSTATSPANPSSSSSASTATSSGPTPLQADASMEFSGESSSSSGGEGEGKVIVPFAARPAEDASGSSEPVAVSPLAPWSRAQASFYDAAPSINKVITPSPAAFTDPHFSIVDSAVHQRAHLSSVPQPPTTKVEVKRSVTTSEHDSPALPSAASGSQKVDASTSANARPRVQARAPVLLEPVWDDGDSFDEESYLEQDAYGGRVHMTRATSPLHHQQVRSPQQSAFLNKPPSFAGPTSPYRSGGAAGVVLPPRHAHGSTHKVIIPTQYRVEAKLAAQQQHHAALAQAGLDGAAADDASAMTLLGLRRPLSMEELEARWKNDMILAAAEGARQAIQQQAQQGLLYSPYASPMPQHHRGSPSQGSGSFGSSSSIGNPYSPQSQPQQQSRPPQLHLGSYAGVRPDGSPLTFGSPQAQAQASPPSTALLLPSASAAYAPIPMGPLPSLPPEPAGTEAAAAAAPSAPAVPAAATSTTPPAATTPPTAASSAGGSHYTASAPFVASLSVASPPPPTFGLPAYQRVGGSSTAPQQTHPSAVRPASYEFGAASALGGHNASPLARAMAAATPYSPQPQSHALPQPSPYSFSSSATQPSGPTYVARPLSPLSSGGVMQGYSRSAVSPPPSSASYTNGYAGIHGAAGPVSPAPAVFVGSAAPTPLSPFASPLRMHTLNSSAVANGFTPLSAQHSASPSAVPQSQAAYEGQQALILSPNSNTPSNARLSFTRAASTAAAVTAVSPSAVHLDSQLEQLQKQLAAFKIKQQQLQAQLGAPSTNTNPTTAATPAAAVTTTPAATAQN